MRALVAGLVWMAVLAAWPTLFTQPDPAEARTVEVAARPDDAKDWLSGTGGNVEALTPDQAERIAREIGLDGVKTEVNDDKTTSIYGAAKGIEVEMSLGECTPQCSDSFDLFAFMGKQSGVDLGFVNAFNIEHAEKMLIQEEGDLALNLTVSLAGGVSRAHLVAVARGFVETVGEGVKPAPK